MIKNFRQTIAVTIAVALAACSHGATAAPAARPTGNVIVARPGGSALVIWDASADVASIVANKTSDADANALLERDASRVLADSLAKIDKDASDVTVRVIYNKSGAVSPVYGSATFAGVERYATLKLSAKDANTDRDKWRELGDAAPPPAWFSFAITGVLPQR
ncbi:MAG: hypothetical protein IAI48_16950 [Candidatus Eremiobacteraeota bacterium]|nr:hypothetical protein [Candidatus Eremiobacteraeota bacterium]